MERVSPSEYPEFEARKKRDRYVGDTGDSETRPRLIATTTLVFTLAMVGFALTAHRTPWNVPRWTCLTVAGLCLCAAWAAMRRPLLTTFGTPCRSHPALRAAAVGVLGIPTAFVFRRMLGIPGFPDSLHAFAAVAVAIGLAEEVIWRGWMQGALAEPFGNARAVVLAAASHTAYKTSLFLFPPTGVPYRTLESLAVMAALTFVFGVLLGIFRARQGWVGPAIAAHVVFDLLVYGDRVTAPWWVV